MQTGLGGIDPERSVNEAITDLLVIPQPVELAIFLLHYPLSPGLVFSLPYNIIAFLYSLEMAFVVVLFSLVRLLSESVYILSWLLSDSDGGGNILGI